MSPLERLAATELARTAPAAAVAMANAVLARWGDAVACILFYGSHRRDGGHDGLLDLYVLVDSYRRVHRRRLTAAFNHLLPPNVLFMTAPFGNGVVRAKVAVISRNSFAARVRSDSLDTTLWTRFCQPSSLLHARDEATADWARATIADAMRTAARHAATLAGPQATSEQRWHALFRSTYRLELRPESQDRSRQVYQAAPHWFDAISAAVAEDDDRHGRQASWRVRAFLGKPLNLLRLVKAAFTFDGGADYLAEKLGRHTGVRVVPTGWQRRHPLLGAPTLLLKHRRLTRR